MAARLVLADVSVAAWERFHTGTPVGIARELASCWTRASTLGAPLDGAAPEDTLLRDEALRLHASHLEVVQALGDSVLDRATARAADRNFLLLLADRDGVVVRTGGGGAFAETANRVRLIEGACWSEAARGTNAIGTAVVENLPTEVHGHAHFGRSYHDLVCYAAPIRGVDGAPIAVLDATSRIECADPEIARTVVDAAGALEQLLRLQAYASAGMSVTRVLARSLDRVREPALWIEAPGKIARANAAARELLGPTLVERDTAHVLGCEWTSLIAEALASRGLRVEVAGRAFRLALEPVAAPDGIILAMVAVLEPVAAVPRIAVMPPSPRIAAARRVAATDPFAAIFAADPGVAAAVAWSRQLAASDLPIMLLAETGAGKELFAQAIHAASPRAAGPLHAVNCGAIAAGLLEAELFGYASGAFTGADRAGRTGLFHAANGGTLFLDEVAEMSPAMQAALLRVLETGRFRRVGDTRLESSDVRVVCATCRDLETLVGRGEFRQDLYYRLKGAVVRIPPLRERTDVVALAEFLLGGTLVLTSDARAAIAAHPWRGNVRELKSVLAVARVVAGDAPALAREHLPGELAAVTADDGTGAGGIAEAEATALARALARAGGNVSEAARLLGVARTTVRRMKRRHGLG